MNGTKLVSTLVGILVLVSIGWSQKPTNSCHSSIWNNNEVTLESKIIGGWERIQIYDVSFCVPEGVKFDFKKGIDLHSWVYEDEEKTITIYIGRDTPGIVISGEFKDYQYTEKNVWINDKYAAIAKYIDSKKEFPNVIAMHIFKEKPIGGYQASIFIRYKTSETKKIAMHLFSTFKFENDKQN